MGDITEFALFAVYVISCAGFYLLGVYHGVKER
jgi:hypothetical protein